MSALNYNPFIKTYFKRKKAEGKKGVITMNNAKNKLVHQMMAVIRSEKPFDPNYKHPKMVA
ncbi:MAG: hypothetical protein U5M51_06375 [Emticicia sp.]|nr:hypothetical protein [Emticicia sp.]